VGLPSETNAADRWAVDHLFLDQDAVPTIIEAKRSSSSELRRTIVGQMLEYAANAVAYWPIDKLRATFEANCDQSGIDPAQNLAQFLGSDADADHFWDRARDNLQSGRVRLVFVADEIPPELQRIVEFLNGQMSPAEVFAVEVRQFVGEGHQALVPRVVGQSATAQLRKSAHTAEAHQWDEASFFPSLEAHAGHAASTVARKLLDWGKARQLRPWWGKGRQDGSYFLMLDVGPKPHWTFSVWTYGRLEVQFEMLRKSPPFDEEANRLELLRRLNEIPGIALPADSITRRPSIPLMALASDIAMERFLSVFDWVIDTHTSRARSLTA
jgi:hypothetical protein